MRKTIIFTILAINIFSSVALALENTVPPEIRRVKLDTKAFDPSKGQMVELSFEITIPADVQVTIYDALGNEVRRFDLPDHEAGRSSIKWDGFKADGERPAGNIFLYVIKAREGERQAIYNPAKETGGILVEGHNFTFDNKTGKLEYVLPKTCMVRLRAGLKNGLLAGTIIDWQPQTAGRHTYNWDGKDDSGLMNLLEHPELEPRLTCYTLPANTIIVTDTKTPLESETNSNQIVDDEGNQKNLLWATDGKYLHYLHDPSLCHEPRFEVLFPTAVKSKENDIAVVSKTVPVRVALDQRDALHLINTRFEVMFFVDGIFIYEVEEGSSPFTFNWDTKGLSKGPHIVTINIIGYEDHIGTVSRKVTVGD